MLALTLGMFKERFDWFPNRSLTAAENLVFFFTTWGGCWSTTKDL